MDAQPKAQILVVEDDAPLNEIVCTFLRKEGYACISAFSGTEARMVVENSDGSPASCPFDLVITDLMLPGLPGEDLVALVRRRWESVPVMVTSAKAGVSDRVELLRCGADDYLVKPFDLNELLARIEVQLRHRKNTAANTDRAFRSGTQNADRHDYAVSPFEHNRVLRFESWEIDPESRTFCVEGAPVRLTRTEFDIALALARNPTRAFSKRDLYIAACHDDLTEADLAAGAIRAADERAVSTHVSNLRAKLKPTGTDNYIETVWGIGFKLRKPQ